MSSVQVLHGDCREVMATLPEASVDAIVCDPPYELGFMGRKWDASGIAFDPATWAAALRVLKPGGHLIAFGGTRTYHRLACAIEDAGFEIRDCICWHYGSGFPKSHDVSKGIDAKLGAEREVVATEKVRDIRNGHGRSQGEGINAADRDGPVYMQREITAPATDAARQWSGWGTALKPATELIVLARKPLDGRTVAENVLLYGTGALNIDGTRVGTEERTYQHSGAPGGNGQRLHGGDGRDAENAKRYAEHSKARGPITVTGRWPANLVHDGSDEVLAGFPNLGKTAGTYNRATAGENAFANVYGGNKPRPEVQTGFGDSGSAARFFASFPSCSERKGDYIREWPDLSFLPVNASTADASSLQQRAAVVSALALAASSALPEGLSCSSCDFQEHFTSATPSELKALATSVTEAIQSIGPRFWLAPPPARLSLSASHARAAAVREPIGTTTITVSHWKSDGSAEPVTFDITPTNSALGAKGYEPPARFRYCAKANKRDRAGSKHPTVKPVALMRWLCRLVTPPAGTILDPFAGSGTTGEAALLEGFNAILIEREDEYVADIKRRLDSIGQMRLALDALADDMARFEAAAF